MTTKSNFRLQPPAFDSPALNSQSRKRLAARPDGSGHASPRARKPTSTARAGRAGQRSSGPRRRPVKTIGVHTAAAAPSAGPNPRPASAPAGSADLAGAPFAPTTEPAATIWAYAEAAASRTAGSRILVRRALHGIDTCAFSAHDLGLNVMLLYDALTHIYIRGSVAATILLLAGLTEVPESAAIAAHALRNILANFLAREKKSNRPATHGEST